MERELPHDRFEMEIAFAGQNAIGVAGQLARHADDIAQLHESEIVRRQQREILEFARPGVVMEDIEIDADVRFAALRDERQAVSRLAQNEAEPRNSRASRTLKAAAHCAACVSETTARWRAVASTLSAKSAAKSSVPNAETLAQIETAFEVIVMSFALLALREQQTALVGGGGQRHFAVFEQFARVGERVLLQVGFQLRQPNFQSMTAAVGVAVDIVGERVTTAWWLR